MEMVTTNNEGFELPDGRSFKWSEVAVVLKVNATISLDTQVEPLITFSTNFDGADGRFLLVSLLEATCPEKPTEGESR